MLYSQLQEFSKNLSEALKLTGGYSIGIIRNGEIENIFYSGYSDIENKTAVSKESSFPISCNTKMITALLAYDTIDIDRPINDYCKISFSNSYVTENITLRDLLCHRSGIHPNSLWTYLMREHDFADAIDTIHKLKTDSFRDKYIYSNLTYSIVGYILERLFKCSYKKIVFDELLKKIGIKKYAFYEKDDAQNKENINAKPYFTKQGHYELGRLLNYQLLNPATGLILDIEEAVKIPLYMLSLSTSGKYKNFFIPNIISNTHKLYKENGYEKYALGLYHKEVYNYDVYYHNGYIVGYSSFIGFIPKLRCGIVILTNHEKSVFPRIVAYKALELLLGINGPNWSSRLLREQQCGEHYKLSFEKRINENYDSLSSNEYFSIIFNKYGLSGKINLLDRNIIINDKKFEISLLNQNEYYTYIADINDYLRIRLENDILTFAGTNIIDLIDFSNNDYNIQLIGKGD